MANAGMIGLLNFIGYGLQAQPGDDGEYANYARSLERRNGVLLYIIIQMFHKERSPVWGEKDHPYFRRSAIVGMRKDIQPPEGASGASGKGLCPFDCSGRIDKRIALGF